MRKPTRRVEPMRTPESTADADQMQDSIHPKQLTGVTASPRARRRNTRERRPGGWMRGKLAQPDRFGVERGKRLRDHHWVEHRNRRGATSSGSTAAGISGPGPLAFAECMRANGVPNFPDPSAARGALFAIPAGTNPAAPGFKTAQAKCQKFMGSGPPVPGTSTHASAQTLTKLLRIAVCMRQHGVSQFPDPRTSVPPDPLAAGDAEITDFDGAILLFPSTIDMQAPAYKQALTACGAPPLGLPH